MVYNRRFLFSLLALGLLLSCTQTPQEMSTKAEKKVKNATVRIENTTGGWGSGFFVEPDKIVTNIHVIQGPRGVYVKDIENTPYHIESVIISDPEHDLVILQVSSKGKHLELGESQQIGEWISAAGYPAEKKKEYELKEGTIRNIWNNSKQLQLVLKSALMEGMSGGAVVNNRGEVVGVSVSGGQTATNPPAFFGGAASVGVLKELLKKSKSAKPMDLLTWNDKPCIRAYGLNKYGKNKIKIAVAEKEDAEKAKSLYNEAIEYFDEATELCPNYADAYFELGKANKAVLLREKSKLSRDTYKAAIDPFTKVVELNPDHHNAYFYRGTAYLHLGENSGSAEERRPHYNAAIIDFNEAIKRNKNDSAYYINRAAAKWHIAELETDREKVFTFLYYEAINDSTEAIRLEPKVTYYTNRATVKFHLGKLAYKRGDGKIAQSMYDEVIKDWTEVIKRTPDNADPIKLDTKITYGYYVRAVLNLLLGQYKASEKNVEEARKLYGAATDDFIQAEKLDPDDVDVYYDKAINALKSDDADTYQMRGLLKSLRGQSVTNQGDVAKARLHYQGAITDYQEAIKRYGKAVKQNSEPIVSTYGNMGYTKYLFGKSFESEFGQENMEHAQNLYEGAIADSTKAIKLNENNASVYHTRGAAKAAIEDYDGAITDLDRCLDLKSDFAEAYYARGLVYQKIGQQEKADADFEQAKKLDPNVGK